MFFRNLVDMKNHLVKFDIILKSNEEFISVTFDCITLIDSYQLLSSSLGSLIKTLVDKNHKTLKELKEEYVDKN